MFTDWTNTDPHYFYLRGMITGVIFILVLFSIVKMISKGIRNNKDLSDY